MYSFPNPSIKFIRYLLIEYCRWFIWYFNYFQAKFFISRKKMFLFITALIFMFINISIIITKNGAFSNRLLKWLQRPLLVSLVPKLSSVPRPHHLPLHPTLPPVFFPLNQWQWRQKAAVISPHLQPLVRPNLPPDSTPNLYLVFNPSRQPLQPPPLIPSLL